MKAVKGDFIITSISARKDRSLGLRVETPELTSEQKIVFLELQNVPLHGVLAPKNEEGVEIETLDKEIKRFSQSQRIRNKLFRLWEQDPDGMSWEEFYYDRTEKIIQWLEDKYLALMSKNPSG